MTYSRNQILLNIALFEAVWWASVLSAAQPYSAWMLVVAVIYVCVHLQWMERWQYALPLLVAALTGCIFDQLGFALGLMAFPGAADGAYIPLWMMALWLAFATTLNVSFQWLHQRLRLAMLLGMVFGPTAYYGASRLGAINLTTPYWSMLWLAVGWAVLMPLLLCMRNSCYTRKP